MKPLTQTGADPLKILVAEDSATQAERLRSILEEHGFDVRVASNGRLALETAREFQPALVISDVVMPEMDGYGLCKALKSDSRTDPTPVILLTSLSDPVDVIRGLECGADNFVVKPYEERQLLARISYMLANREMREGDAARMGVEIAFAGQRYFITSDRLQILNLLLSTYETAIQKNQELLKVQGELKALAERLEEKVEERTAALAAAEMKFRHLVERSLVGIYIIQDGRFVYVNPRLCEILGYAAEELTSRPVQEFIAAPHRALALENIRKRVSGEVDSIHYTLCMVRKDGGIIHAEVHGGRSEYSGRTAVLGTLLDVTQRVEAENAIRRLNEELEQRVKDRTAELEAANKDLESFSFSVSHDLRAPLRAVSGFATMLVEEHGGELSGAAQRKLEVIRGSARQMGQLIEGLLEFARLGRKPICSQRVDVRGLVQSVLDSLGTERQGRQVELVVGELPPCSGDPMLLRQVFFNLLSNAHKYTRKRDVARIEVGAQPDPASGGTAYFVRDNGAGFDMQYAHKLFNVFQRLHAAGDFEGTGVGLAIVARVVQRHGGRIWAEAEPDRGAIFHLTLGGGPAA